MVGRSSGCSEKRKFRGAFLRVFVAIPRYPAKGGYRLRRVLPVGAAPGFMSRARGSSALQAAQGCTVHATR